MSEVTNIKKHHESETAVDNDDGNSTCSEFERISHKDGEHVFSEDLRELDEGQKTPTDSVMNFGTFQNFEQIRNELTEIRKEMNATNLKVQQLVHEKEMEKVQAELATMKLKKSEEENFAKILQELRKEITVTRAPQQLPNQNVEIILVDNSGNGFSTNAKVTGDWDHYLAFSPFADAVRPVNNGRFLNYFC